MSLQFSPILASRARSKDDIFFVQSVEVQELGPMASPIAVLDHFRVRGHPFGIHPHAGFCAVAYVLEDSAGACRSRDSLGNDYVTAPGGIIWTQAGSGVVHEDFPLDPGRELHGVQIFVNLSSKNKFVAPQVMRLATSAVPEWRSAAGDRVRVLVGTFEGVSSPLVSIEPFTLLDIELRGEISFSVPDRYNALAYILEGNVRVQADGHEREVSGEHALALGGSGGRVMFQAHRPARLLVLAGAEVREPVVYEGNAFIMNTKSQIEDAMARYRAGEMGHLAPLSRS